MKLIAYTFAILLLASCVSTAPISVAWRSNSSLQTATTDGQTTNSSNDPSVNADKTAEVQSAVATSSGSASTASQDQSNKPAEKEEKSEPVKPATEKAEETGVESTDKEAVPAAVEE